MPQPLQIHPNAPFKPTFLSIPPSPITPQTPIKIPSLRPILPSTRITTSPPPPSPLQWVWQCHQCRRNYSLGVTRRCLEDGHTFCAGTTVIHRWRTPRNPRRIRRRHGACASEFDYVGWKAWGCWRRRQEVVRSVWEDSDSEDEEGSCSTEADEDEKMIIDEPQEVVRDCWSNCDYPSQCRWGSRFGVKTPTTPERPVIATSPTVASSSEIPETSEGVLKMENLNTATKRDGKDETFWGALMASATRRNRGAASPSPLKLDTVAEEAGKEDVVMKEVSPTSYSVAATLTALSNTPVKVKEMIKSTCTRAASSSSSSPANKPQRQRRNAISPTSEERPHHGFDFGFDKGEEGDEDEEDEGDEGSLRAKKSRKSTDSGYGSLMDELRVGRV